MKFRILVVFWVLIMVSGCASTKRIAPVNITYKDLKVAANGVDPILRLNVGDRKRILIQEHVSPKIDLDNSDNYFEVVSLEGEDGQSFDLEVTSICDCLGFRKWAVLSDPYLIAPSGRVAKVKQVGNPQGRRITGEFSESGTYKLIVVANSKFTGHRMGSIDGYFPDGITTLSLPLTVHPTGTVVVGRSR